ncbi:MAG: hypothetical protein H8E62_10910 [Planctomycetes bacterium]|nr:hypothetical protein [Planctomycetota bacterium]
MKIPYEKRRFQEPTLELIAKVNAIAEDYQAKGYKITLRQLFYQLVSRNIVPNLQKKYKSVGKHLVNARNAGLLDWDLIIDRTRGLSKYNHWDSPAEIVRSASHWYHIDTRMHQPHYIEVWCEKDALASILNPVSNKNDIPLLICRGYSSVTCKHDAANRLRRHEDPIILYLGDHDPSGEDMVNDIRNKFDLYGCGHVEVRRIGLNPDQIKQYNLPSQMAKKGDSRAEKFIEKHGKLSWELDALPPDALTQIVQDEIDLLTDYDKLEARRLIQNEHRNTLRRIAGKMEDGACDDCDK